LKLNIQKGSITNVSRSLDKKLEESNKYMKMSNQDFKAEFNTSLKTIELSSERIEGKRFNNFELFLR